MATLGIKQDEPNRLVLETPASQTLSNLFELVIVLAVAYSFLAPFFENPNADPLQLLGQDPLVAIGILIGLFIIVRLLSSMLTGTRVVVDSTQRRVTRTNTVLGLPVGVVELPFDQVKDVRVGSPLPVTFAGTSGRRVWQLVLDSPGRRPFIVNSRGLHDEMRAMGDKVANLTGRPLVDELEQAASQAQAEPAYTPIQDFGGGASTTVAPPVAVPGRLGRRDVSSRLPEKQPPPNVLTQDSQSPEHSLFEQQMNEAYSGPTAPAETAPASTAGGPVMGSAPDSGEAMIPSMPPMGMPGMPVDTGQPPASPAPPAAAAPDMGMPTVGGIPMMGSMPPLGGTTEGTPSYSAPPLQGPSTGMEMGQSSYSSPPTEPAARPPQPSSQAAPGGWVRPRTFEEMQQAIAQDPTDARAQYEMARLLHARGDYNGALAAYTSAIHLAPYDAAAQNDMGVLHMQRRRFAEAEAAFRRAAGLDPFLVVSQYNLGLLLVRTGRRKEAMQAFTRGLQSAGTEAEQQLFTNAQKGIYVDPLLSQP